ncbi:unnamed protein product [Owenia fusiformis]|nr:unnamed protein product [Owenia fusiformis]
MMFISRLVAAGSTEGACFENNLAFLVSTTYTFTRAYHKEMRTISFPFTLIGSIGSVGRSSFEFVSTFESDATNAKLVTCSAKLALVDPSTRRSTEIPKDIINRIKATFDLDPPQKIEPVERPKDIHVFNLEIIVQSSDLDMNMHSNHSAYTRFCCDAAAAAIANKAFKNFEMDICRYEIKSMSNLFKGESRANDVLTVFTWEDNSERKTIHFEIIKNDNPIFHSTMVYYSDNEISKL